MDVNTDTSGGTRFSEGKPKGWRWVPMAGLKLIAPVSWDGGVKYAPGDWRVGQKFSTLFDSMTRHFLDIQERGIWAKDAESGHYSLAHMTWNALCLLTFMVTGRHELDDLTVWDGVTYEHRVWAERVASESGLSVEEVLRESPCVKVTHYSLTQEEEDTIV